MHIGVFVWCEREEKKGENTLFRRQFAVMVRVKVRGGEVECKRERQTGREGERERRLERERENRADFRCNHTT